MAVYGVTDAGFVVKPYDAIRASISAYLRDPTRLGAGLDLSSSEPLGQVVDGVALELAEVWALAQALFPLIDPGQAEGVALANILGGHFNFPALEATPTTATVTITGTAATVIPAGSQISQSSTGDVYATDAEVTIGSGGTVTATVSEVGFETRPWVPEAAAGSLTVIETPISGWTSVTNAADAVPGTLDETDVAYYIRFQRGGRATGASNTAPALYARLIQVTDVNEVIVRENLTDVTDALGQPSRSFWCIFDVDDDTDLTQRQTLASTILAHKPAGMRSYGSVAVTVTSPPAGTLDPTVYLDYVTETNIYIRVLSVVTDGNEPSDWETVLKAALVAEGNTLTIGADVIYGRFCKVAYAYSWFLSATIYVGTSAITTGQANITVNPPAIARFDTSRVEVTSA